MSECEWLNYVERVGEFERMGEFEEGDEIEVEFVLPTPNELQITSEDATSWIKSAVEAATPRV